MEINQSSYNLFVVLGPTATGKTGFATHLAKYIDSEIISADSRQVYREMNIGTGKDLDEYIIDNQNIPYHLIDILEAGESYNVFRFQHDFFEVYKVLREKGKLPIMCGGTGLYIESIINNYALIEVPPNEKMRNELETKTMEELIEILSELKKLHATTDIDTKKRAIRAIEIEIYTQNHPEKAVVYPQINPLLIGIECDRDTRRQRITSRLRQRLQNGMIDEVKNLIASGVPTDTLIFYGLEYKHITEYLLGLYSYEKMFEKLEIAIHQFAKRQMTWFRKMERDGWKIHWLSSFLSNEEKISRTLALLGT